MERFFFYSSGLFTGRVFILCKPICETDHGFHWEPNPEMGSIVVCSEDEIKDFGLYDQLMINDKNTTKCEEHNLHNFLAMMSVYG